MEIHKFNAKTKGWPSSTRAEIIAILTTLLVVKKHSVVNIYTDSKNTIISIENKYKLLIINSLKIKKNIKKVSTFSLLTQSINS